MNTFRFPPKEVVDAAFLLSAWMAEHNKEYWQLGGVCDRRYAYRSEAYMGAITDLTRQPT